MTAPIQPTNDVIQIATDGYYTNGPFPGYANKQIPSSGIQAEGFLPGMEVPAENANYVLNNHGEWIEYLRARGGGPDVTFIEGERSSGSNISGIYLIPTGCKWLEITVIAPGGGGGGYVGTSPNFAGGGGGSGGILKWSGTPPDDGYTGTDGYMYISYLIGKSGAGGINGQDGTMGGYCTVEFGTFDPFQGVWGSYFVMNPARGYGGYGAIPSPTGLDGYGGHGWSGGGGGGSKIAFGNGGSGGSLGHNGNNGIFNYEASGGIGYLENFYSNSFRYGITAPSYLNTPTPNIGGEGGPTNLGGSSNGVGAGGGGGGNGHYLYSSSLATIPMGGNGTNASIGGNGGKGGSGWGAGGGGGGASTVSLEDCPGGDGAPGCLLIAAWTE